MLEEKNTPAAEVNEPEETVNDTQDTNDETNESTEPTIGETTDDVVEETPVVDTIPKARLDKEIRRRKELEAKLAELESLDDDEENTPASDNQKSDLEARLEKIEAKEKSIRLNATLESNITAALENAPEFKDVVNMDVIKQMALNPANKSKTYSQLLEEAYGNALGDRRVVETTTPRGGANNEKVDIARTQRDKEYLKEVLSDPDLKKQYNQGLEHRINL